MSNVVLPVFSFRDEIVRAVADHPVVIVTAETGAGKSTQVPQYLLEAGYRILVTQPRRLAARTVAARVAEEYGSPFGGVVGYRTAYERKDCVSTRCLFVTDGLALVRELVGAGRHTVLVIDEVHEWNLNIEVLVAWAKRQVESSVASFKLVLMSATLEAERLSSYFGGAPIIDVPGRMYPVEELQPQGDLVDDAAGLLRQGRNVLVFLPGKREIGDLAADLRNIEGLAAVILPLHGELSAEEQAACFRSYSVPKCVIATNIAQTSVTIPDIDAVVDSGMERRVDLADGVEGLYLCPISRADQRQRKGRAGRTRPGVYISHAPVINVPEFPVAEIDRVRLDQTVLRLAEVGIDAEELEFFHQPDFKKIHAARQALVALGCMTIDGAVTAIGRRVAKLPISVQYGRMVIEAERLGVVDDVLDIAAILEQGGITAHRIKINDIPMPAKPVWTKLFCPDEESSDVMAQLAVYRAAANLSKDDMYKSGIFVKAYFQAREKRRNLAQALRGKIVFGSSGDRGSILKAVCAGLVDHLYQYIGGSYCDNDGQFRQLNDQSVVAARTSWVGDNSHWLVGLPWDLEVKGRNGSRIVNLVRLATRVEPAWLAEVAPQLLSTAVRGYRFDAVRGCVVADEVTIFNGHDIGSKVVVAPKGLESTAAVVVALVSGTTGHPAELHNLRVLQQLDDLAARSGGMVQSMSSLALEAFYAGRVMEAACREDLDRFGLELDLDELAPAAVRDEVDRLSPRSVRLLGRDYAVVYRQGLAPTIRLTVEEVESGDWDGVADEALTLPCGRPMRLVVPGSFYDEQFTNVEAVREWIVRRRRQAEAEAERRAREVELERKQAEAVAKAMELQRAAEALYEDNRHEILDDPKLVSRLYEVAYGVIPYYLRDIYVWIESAEAVIAQAEEVLTRPMTGEVSSEALRELAARFAGRR